jgi:hypothetical protein
MFAHFPEEEDATGAASSPSTPRRRGPGECASRRVPRRTRLERSEGTHPLANAAGSEGALVCAVEASSLAVSTCVVSDARLDHRHFQDATRRPAADAPLFARRHRRRARADALADARRTTRTSAMRRSSETTQMWRARIVSSETPKTVRARSTGGSTKS